MYVAKEHLVHRLAKMAGLRRCTVDVDDAGTVMSVWAPKDKLPAADDAAEATKKEAKRDAGRLSVVLIHGFAGDGIFTWVLQVGALANHYDVYVPDLLFFGGSTSGDARRTPAFQAECVAAALRRLGVERCAAVGFSYGGFVAFRMAEAHPGLVAAVVCTGSLPSMPRSTNEAMLRRLGAASFAELLLPDDVAGLRSLFAAGAYGKWSRWFPDFVLKDYLELMIFNRKERAELLEGIVVSDKDAAAAPSFQQDILLLWGENDSMFTMELANKLKEQLGEKASLRSISKAGHLVMLERPRVFSRCLREFLQQQQQPRTTAAASEVKLELLNETTTI
ncbi:unnamed protein product [Urochloa decumbens]|uniref:AB hydrolase-1 domain-containing protein n=1 Tax=Urochloa decumbens TaxID=240449 RepID=A0ABC9G5Q6_9POAL